MNNMVTIPKREYTEILKRQARTEVIVKRLVRTVDSYIENNEDELRPEVAARIKRQLKLVDAGKGTKLANMKEYRAFVRAL